MKLAIELTVAQEQRLTKIAECLNVPAELLAKAAVRELVAESEADFDRVATRLMPVS